MRMESFRRARSGPATFDRSYGATVHQDPPCITSASDVSSKQSALCVLNCKGKIVRETKLPTDPEVIARFIGATGLPIERIGLESGCTAAWLFAGLLNSDGEKAIEARIEFHAYTS